MSRDATALNAADEPMLMRPRSMVIITESVIEYRGSFDWGSTLDRYREPGMPLSRAKAHIIREVAARTAIHAIIIIESTTETMAVAPPLDFVACWKISINGKPVVLDRALSILPMQKRIASSIANPRTPLRPIEASKE